MNEYNKDQIRVNGISITSSICHLFLLYVVIYLSFPLKLFLKSCFEVDCKLQENSIVSLCYLKALFKLSCNYSLAYN